MTFISRSSGRPVARMGAVKTNPFTGRKYLRCSFRVFGYPVDLTANNHYGREDRAVFVVGFENKSGHWSLLLQRYREGSRLESHVDLDGSNRCLWFLLKRARIGGDLIVEGPCRSFLCGRVKVFDGGVCRHEVTTVERGSRVSLILQHGVPK